MPPSSYKHKTLTRRIANSEMVWIGQSVRGLFDSNGLFFGYIQGIAQNIALQLNKVHGDLHFLVQRMWR